MAELYVIAYRDFGRGLDRPYLGMQLTGLNRKTETVFGILDTGADQTALPFGYAPLLGYSADDVRAQPTTQAGGSLVVQLALRPVTAVVPEIEDVVIEIHPLFVLGSTTVLWGRRDVMRHFDVTIMESQQAFSLTPVD
jgi:hypothetical protein